MSKNLIGALILAAAAGSAFAGPISLGNLVVIRVGDGNVALGTAAAPTFLDEYTPTGTLVQSIAMPSTVSGTNFRCLQSGNSTSEGQLTRSADGRYLTLGGYDAAVGTASVGSSSTGGATPVLRVVARVGFNGVVDTTTTTTAFSGNQIRGVVSNDGGQFWATGGNNGVQYFSSLGGTSSTQLNSLAGTSTNNRMINIVNGQLYIDSASSSLRGIAAVGSGLPTTNGQALSAFTGMAVNTSSSGYDFAIINSNLLYLADDSAAAGLGGIQRWELVSGTWTRTATFALSNGGKTRQITTTTNASGQVVVYATVLDSSNVTTIQSLTDIGNASTFNLVATGSASTIFRGIEFAPIPAPGSLGLLGLGGLVATRRRR